MNYGAKSKFYFNEKENSLLQKSGHRSLTVSALDFGPRGRGFDPWQLQQKIALSKKRPRSFTGSVTIMGAQTKENA